jgi:hypothetical protein
MNPDKTPLVNQLTLLVLCLILVCLVLLVGRAYQKQPRSGESPAVAEAETAPVAIEESSPTTVVSSPLRPPQPPRRPSATNTIRAAQSARASSPVPDAVPSETPGQATEPPVAFVDVSYGEQTGAAVVTGANGVSSALTGWVTLTGTPKPEIPIPLGPTCSALHPGKVTTRHFVVSPEGGLANVLVDVGNVRFGRPLVDPPLLDQVGCMFEPYVLGVVAGQSFRVRNSDATLHNIHATPKINREFNIAQGQRGQVDQFSFPKPELFVRLKCDVHPWMFAYVNVLAHPFFAITDTNGVFRLPGALPAGDYVVRAIHLKAGELTQRVTIGDGEPRPLHFQFSVPAGTQPQSGVARSN